MEMKKWRARLLLNRVLTVVLTFAMVVSSVPTYAFAEASEELGSSATAVVESFAEDNTQVEVDGESSEAAAAAEEPAADAEANPAAEPAAEDAAADAEATDTTDPSDGGGKR